MAVKEYSGILSTKNANGDTHLFYPVTLKDCVDGIDEIENDIAELQGAVATAALASNLTAEIARAKAAEQANATAAAEAKSLAAEKANADANGAANSANKLNTDAGSATHPVFFKDGVPVAINYTLGTSVPAGAKFTDTVYTHPTASGNKHIPSGGSAGQILKWSEDGTAVWGDNEGDTDSAPVYAQPDEPADAPDGSIWVDTDEESGAAGAETVDQTARDAAANAQSTADSKAPMSHSSTGTTFGMGTSTYFGHVKLSDSITGYEAADGGGTAATPAAVMSVHLKANTGITKAESAQATADSAVNALAGCWISFTDENGSPTDEPYIHWAVDESGVVANYTLPSAEEGEF